MKNGISIGAEKESVAEAHKAIIAILKSGQDQETIREALKVLGTACKVEGITIQNCSVVGK
jgi:hypothetical protein